jgi:hypothetical protein
MASAYLILATVCLALGLRADDDCISRSFAIRNLTALAPQIVTDRADPSNNAVVFQLYNPITSVSGECAAHGASLAPDTATSEPEEWYSCFVESRDPSISVQFQYDSATSQLTVNETWICEEDEVDGIFRWVKLDERTSALSLTIGFQGYVPGIRLRQLDAGLRGQRQSAYLSRRARR